MLQDRLFFYNGHHSFPGLRSGVYHKFLVSQEQRSNSCNASVELAVVGAEIRPRTILAALCTCTSVERGPSTISCKLSSSCLLIGTQGQCPLRDFYPNLNLSPSYVFLILDIALSLSVLPQAFIAQQPALTGHSLCPLPQAVSISSA